MRENTRGLVLAALLAGVAIAGLGARSEAPQASGDTTKQRAEEVIASWKSKPREVAKEIIAKYGQPDEVTTNRLIWHENGPWKYTELVNQEIPHNFPIPHKDMLYQAINFRIDPDKADELLEYDGSLILERTKGEIAARCDKEAANFLAINLANDVADGRRSVDQARQFYLESIMAMMKQGKRNKYLQGFQFEVAQSDQGDPGESLKAPAGADRQE